MGNCHSKFSGGRCQQARVGRFTESEGHDRREETRQGDLTFSNRPRSIRRLHWYVVFLSVVFPDKLGFLIDERRHGRWQCAFHR